MASKDPVAAAITGAVPELGAAADAIQAFSDFLEEEQARVALSAVIAENQEAFAEFEASLDLQPVEAVAEFGLEETAMGTLLADGAGGDDFGGAAGEEDYDLD